MFCDVTDKIKALLQDCPQFRLAIDGRCGAGKTTLAQRLGEELGAAVIHLDDFFLPKDRSKAGFGNIEKERLLQQVLIPMSSGQQIRYQIFDCHTQSYMDWVILAPNTSVIVEGSYALLPEFRFAYTHSVFVDVTAQEQERRIRKRNGAEAWEMFRRRWIPDEEECFLNCGNRECANLTICYK